MAVLCNNLIYFEQVYCHSVIFIYLVLSPVPSLKPGPVIKTFKMKKLTRNDLKKIKGGGPKPCSQTYCTTNSTVLPMGCFIKDVCPPPNSDEVLLCCYFNWLNNLYWKSRKKYHGQLAFSYTPVAFVNINFRFPCNYFTKTKEHSGIN